MLLEDFAYAAATDDGIYELERGVVVVVDVPGMPHEWARDALRRELYRYMDRQPDVIRLISDGSGSVIRAWELQSERHPDLTIYLSPPPTDDPQPWDEWTPDIVVEIVSASSRKRGYETKAVDYLAAGVRQYWIIDPLDRSATICHRRGDTWRKQQLTVRGKLKSGLLPEFELPLARVLAKPGRK